MIISDNGDGTQKVVFDFIDDSDHSMTGETEIAFSDFISAEANITYAAKSVSFVKRHTKHSNRK